MYGIYANIWGISMVNVTIYSIHGSYGYWNQTANQTERMMCFQTIALMFRGRMKSAALLVDHVDQILSNVYVLKPHDVT